MRSGILMLAHVDSAAAMRHLEHEITVIGIDPATIPGGEEVVEPVHFMPQSLFKDLVAEYEPPSPMDGERPMNRKQRRDAARKKIK